MRSKVGDGGFEELDILSLCRDSDRLKLCRSATFRILSCNDDILPKGLGDCIEDCCCCCCCISRGFVFGNGGGLLLLILLALLLLAERFVGRGGGGGGACLKDNLLFT